MKHFSFILISIYLFLNAEAQQSAKYNLVELLQKNKLEDQSKEKFTASDDKEKAAITGTGIIWLKEVSFKEGIIEIDLRGKNILQQSFLGIAFHGRDTSAYEAVYFRPFNFHNADTLRRKHAVEYISMPHYPWYKLRDEHPLMYEKEINPVPDGNAWFHASILIRNDSIFVYVNHSKVPSLQVKELQHTNEEKIGLWNDGLKGNFANLEIKK